MQNGQVVEADNENVLAALAGKEFFWLDLDDATTDGTVAELLGTHFGFHPLAVQAAEKFSQRPRFDDYDDFVYLVARGADPEQGCGRGALLLDRHLRGHGAPGRLPGHCSGARTAWGGHQASDAASPQIVIVYLIIDSLVDSFFPSSPTSTTRSTPWRTTSSRRPPRSSWACSST
jgi:magnesium transporter